MRRPDSYASLQPTHSTIVSIIKPSYRSLPAASKHTALPRSHLPHQPNPHSGVRGILCAPSPAGSFLGGFRTPATGVCRAAVAGRHPKPSTQADIVCANERGRHLRRLPAKPGELFRRLWHGRGMMVDDEPVLAVLYVSEAVARGEYLGFSVLDRGKGVIAGIDRRTAVHADQLIAEGNLEPRKNPKGRHEIIPQCRPIGTHRRGQGP